MKYRLKGERYMNSGIVRNFEYDAIITGTSMSENFRTSELEELFDVTAVKVPLAGASYKEINRFTEMALDANKNIKMIVRTVDAFDMVRDKNYVNYREDQWPEYLYDKNPINDIKYLFNIETIYAALTNCYMTVRKIPSTAFDAYENWSASATTGKEHVLWSYSRPDKVETKRCLSAEEEKLIRENITQNVTAVARENPNVTFYYFIPPYSIVSWDRENQTGSVEYQIEVRRVAIEEMLKYSNIKVFDFSAYMPIVGDLDNYIDTGHYSGEINTLLLKLMREEQCLITEENFNVHIESMYEIFVNYDYEAIFMVE